MSRYNNTTTEEQKQQIIAMAKEGLSDVKIAVALNMPPANVQYWRTKAGIFRHKTKIKDRKDILEGDLPPITLDPELRSFCYSFIGELREVMLQQIFNRIRGV